MSPGGGALEVGVAISGSTRGDAASVVASYKRLAEVFHDVLSEHDPASLLERIADTLADLTPYDTLTIYRSQGAELIPILARDPWEAEEILRSRSRLGEGLTGWAAEHREAVLANQAQTDPRSIVVEGTELSPESVIVVPLIARKSLKGVIAVYRLGKAARFSQEEFELVTRFGDAAALALDNAEIRAFLEHQAQTDALTGCYNHRFFQERLRSELTRAARAHDAVSLVMLDIDDFKKLNDVFGHGLGDHVLVSIADMLRGAVRASDIVCRLGGEEFAVIMPSCDAGDALGLASRISERLEEMTFEPAGSITISAGVAQGPDHAANPRELLACAEAAMMTAKARGKNGIVLFDEGESERPEVAGKRDVRSIAHLKMLQSLSAKLNRLNETTEIGETIANELRTLIDYHNCRVYSVEGDLCVPIAFRGEWTLVEGVDAIEVPPVEIGRGIAGRVAARQESLLIENALECDFAMTLPGSQEIEESVMAVPLTFGTRSIGVVVVSKLGVSQFDEDDLRLMEVLAGHASVALENARLYEAQRREAANARALLESADVMARVPTFEDVVQKTVELAARLLDGDQASLWLEAEGGFRCAAAVGFDTADEATPLLDHVVQGPPAERVFEEGEAPFVMEPEDASHFFDIPAGVIMPRRAVAPLPEAGGIKGWITVRQPPDAPGAFFTEERLRLLAAFAYQAALALQRARLFKQQHETAEIAGALLEVGRQLASAETLGEVLDKVVLLAAHLLESPRTSVWIQELETGDFVAEAQHGYEGTDLEILAALRYPEEVFRQWVAGDDPFTMLPGQVAEVAGAPTEASRVSYAVAPLRLDDGRVGCIVAAAPETGDYRFAERKIRLMTGMAHQARLAINRAANFEDLERTFISTVEVLTNTLEAKDAYTSEHARSITQRSIAVGQAMGFDETTLKRLELGALFHDIGKIGIPSSILLKEGPLTPEECEVMKQHPELGERLLQPIERLRDVCPIVRAGHERWDGRGYPDGKAGEDIPIEARIIFVCDAFDAMTTDRPYRTALAVDDAIERLRRGAGTQFDPDVVDIFLSILERELPAPV